MIKEIKPDATSKKTLQRTSRGAKTPNPAVKSEVIEATPEPVPELEVVEDTPAKNFPWKLKGAKTPEPEVVEATPEPVP